MIQQIITHSVEPYITIYELRIKISRSDLLDIKDQDKKDKISRKREFK